MITIFEKYNPNYIKRNKYEYGDYIIYNLRHYRTDNDIYLTILNICGTPGPEGHKVDYYTCHVYYKFDNNKLIELNWDEPMRRDTIHLNKKLFEYNVLYCSKDLEKVKQQIYLINDTQKYNI